MFFIKGGTRKVSCEKSFVYNGSKRRRNIRVFRVNRIIALIIFITIIVSLGITFFAINYNTRKNIDTHSFYYLQLGEYTSSKDAMSKSIELQKVGGSGYVLNDGVFRVMATVFAKKSDAQSVATKLELSGNPCVIHEVKTPKLRLVGFDSDTETSQIRRLVDYPIGEFFSKIQSLDIALDSGETSDSAVLLALGNLKNQILDGYQQITLLLQKHPTNSLLGGLAKLYNQISTAFNNYLPQTELTVGTALKSILCNLVESYIFYLK